MGKFFEIGQKIERKPSQVIIIVLINGLFALAFNLMIEFNYLETAASKIIFCVAFLILCAIASVCEYKSLIKKMSATLTKEEITYYMIFNFILEVILIVIFTVILFLI